MSIITLDYSDLNPEGPYTFSDDEFQNLDLPADPLQETPDLDALTYKYTDEARSKFLPYVHDYEKVNDLVGLSKVRLDGKKFIIKFMD